MRAFTQVGSTYVSFGSARGTLEWYYTDRGRTLYVRKYLYLAMAAASAAVLAAPVVAQAAPAAHPHVLTIKKAGGTAVNPGATLKASLKKGTDAVFSLTGINIKCKESSFTAKAVKNPTAPGTATESVTSETIGKCTISIAGGSVKSVKAVNLPYNSTVSDKKGLPVTIAGTKKSKPIELSSTASALGETIKCNYTAKTVAGTASNKGSTITVKNAKFSKGSGSNSLCPATATFSATYGPVQDTSVKGNPAVFVN
jgi:hypothetical protein